MANKSLPPRVTGAFTSGAAGAAFVDLSHEIFRLDRLSRASPA